MYNIKEILSKESVTSDRLCEIFDFIDDLFENKEIQEKYGEDLRMLIVGPHFDLCTLEESGIKIKYTCEDIMKTMSALGISFNQCITNEDIVYTVNMVSNLYYPLITDLPTALKFSEKYIKDPEWPIEYGKPYSIWRYMRDL